MLVPVDGPATNLIAQVAKQLVAILLTLQQFPQATVRYVERY